MDFKLKREHTHRGILHPAGATIQITEAQADRLEGKGIGERVKVYVPPVKSSESEGGKKGSSKKESKSSRGSGNS